MQETKQCPKCREVLPTSSFQKNKTAKDGLQYHCKVCRKQMDCREEHRAQHRKRYHENKENYRNSTYKRKYGISLDEYEKLLTEQHGLCAICSGECPSKRSLAVDHDHATGKVRGLLCANCNRGLGMFKDKIQALEKAITYLEKAQDGKQV